MNTLIYSLKEINRAADFLYQHRSECKIYTFTGPLGAGKTTLIQQLLYQFGVREPIISPTFNYVNIYHNEKGQMFYHFDLYRISSVEEFIAFGFDEYLSAPNSWSFIEWPEVIKPLLKERVCNVAIDYEGLEKRKLVIQIH